MQGPAVLARSLLAARRLRAAAAVSSRRAVESRDPPARATAEPARQGRLAATPAKPVPATRAERAEELPGSARELKAVEGAAPIPAAAERLAAVAVAPRSGARLSQPSP